MSLIAGQELYEIIEKGYLTANPDNVNAASIDITLGNTILMEDLLGDVPYVDLAAKETLAFEEVLISDDGYVLYPGHFILGESVEMFNLPEDISCQFVLKSSMARNGLEHLMAGWADAGFNGSVLTYEFKNLTQFHPLLLRKGMKVGQMKFYRHAPAGDNSYANIGSYNNRTKPVAK